MGDELVRAETTNRLTIGAGRRRVQASLTPAAAAVMRQWDTSQRRRSGHEAAHACVGARLAQRVVGVSIRGAHGAWTLIEEPGSTDDQPEWLTRDETTAMIVTMLAGRAFDIALFGQPTTGSETDITRATEIATSMWDSGMLTGQSIVSRGPTVWGFGPVPRRIEAELVDAVIAQLAESARRADELVSELGPAISSVAEVIYEHRRLSDRELAAVLESVGLPVDLGE